MPVLPPKKNDVKIVAVLLAHPACVVINTCPTLTLFLLLFISCCYICFVSVDAEETLAEAQANQDISIKISDRVTIHLTDLQIQYSQLVFGKSLGKGMHHFL